MQIDFTIKVYTELIKSFTNQGFVIKSFNDYLTTTGGIVFRQDVDKLPNNSLKVARIQYELGIKSTYFFRILSGSFDLDIIEQIEKLGHEIGYHYEDLPLALSDRRNRFESRKELTEREVAEVGIASFDKNLKELRKYVDVNTICMHGSPLSKWDSRLLWKYYDYRDYKIIGEPYFDIDFSKTLYLTDTGRSWNGYRFSIRDKLSTPTSFNKLNSKGPINIAKIQHSYKDWKVQPKPNSALNMTSHGNDFQSRYNYKTTWDIIHSIEHRTFPFSSMFTFHPQRWSDSHLPWLKEFVLQNAKNGLKYFLLR
jgi:hypothetical protein